MVADALRDNLFSVNPLPLSETPMRAPSLSAAIGRDSGPSSYQSSEQELTGKGKLSPKPFEGFGGPCRI